MNMINKTRLGFVLGSVLGLCHVTWCILVATGLAQWSMNWIFRLHFIQPVYTIAPFNIRYAVALVVFTTLTGCVFGWLLAAAWNWLSETKAGGPIYGEHPVHL